MSTAEMQRGEDSGYMPLDDNYAAKVFATQAMRDSAYECQVKAWHSDLAPIAFRPFQMQWKCGLPYGYVTGIAAPLGADHSQEDTVKVIAGLIRAGIQPIDLMPWQFHNFGCDPKDRSKVWAVDFSRCRMVRT